MALHFAWLMLSVIGLCGASEIIFMATPPIIKKGLKQTLTLSCSLQDTPSGETTKFGDIWSSVKENLSVVKSIVIRKEEGQREVARIDYGRSPVAGPEEENARVTGNLVFGQTYLKVTWSQPDEKQAGSYNCDITASSPLGSNIKFSANTDVFYESNSEDLRALVLQAQKDIEALEKRINASHYEEGIIICENSNQWGEPMKHRESIKDVSFNVPYEKLPAITVAVVRMDIENTHSARYWIDIRDRTTSGFKIACITWWDTFITSLHVRWTSTAA